MMMIGRIFHVVYDYGDEEDMNLRVCGLACELYIKTQGISIV